MNVKMMVGKLDSDVMGLAETFLQREEEIEVGDIRGMARTGSIVKEQVEELDC